MQLVKAIGYVAEAANHHPDLVVTWGHVELRVQTHTERAITDKDLEFARQIDAAVLWRPSREGALGGGTRRAWVVAEPP